MRQSVPEIRRLPEFDGLYGIAVGIEGRPCISDPHPYQLEPCRIGRGRRDVDLRAVKANEIAPLAVANAEALGLFPGHGRQRTDEAGSILEGTGAAATIGIAGIGQALGDMVGEIDSAIAA